MAEVILNQDISVCDRECMFKQRDTVAPESRLKPGTDAESKNQEKRRAAARHARSVSRPRLLDPADAYRYNEPELIATWEVP